MGLLSGKAGKGVVATTLPRAISRKAMTISLLSPLLGVGVGVEAGLAAVLIYRGLSLGLPLTVGFFIVQRELLKK